MALTEEMKQIFIEACENLAGMGERVLGFVHLDLDPTKFPEGFHFSTDGDEPTLTSVVPVDLKLIVEHITAQTYSEWDLELLFEDQDWTVVLVGYHIQSTSQSSLDLLNGVSDPSLSRSGQ